MTQIFSENKLDNVQEGKLSGELLQQLLTILRREGDGISTEEVMSMVPLSFSMTEADRAILIPILREKARAKRMTADFEQVLRTHEDLYRRRHERSETLIRGVPLRTTRRGQVMQSMTNFLAVMEHDPYYAGHAWDVLSDRAVIREEGKIRPMQEVDRAESLRLCEENYSLSSDNRHDQAQKIFLRKRSFHPVMEALDDIVWDKKPRIEGFLTKWMKAEDTPYVREVSRLIFSGGIHRLYNPGCKFDEMPVLVGTKQGEGKSTLVRELALQEDWYRELTDMEGQIGIEQISGGWIVEVSELLALSRARELEGVKAFLSRQSDHYRKPYDHVTSDLPRRCIFIGTTNDAGFLRDKTGNRRFFPVRVHSTGQELFERMEELRSDIRQCWAEARDRYEEGTLLPHADPGLTDAYRAAQTEAMEDDWRVGVIGAYLEKLPVGETVCIRQIVKEVLYPDALDRPYDARESRQIGQILNGMADWECVGIRKSKRYGKQKQWMRIEGSSLKYGIQWQTT